jgi:hypothetical protein
MRMRRLHRVLAVAALGAAVSGLVAAPAAAAHDYHSTPDGWAPGNPPGEGAQVAGEDHFPYDYLPYDQPPEQGWMPVH